MRQILYSAIMLAVLGTTACGNRNNTEGTDQYDRLPDNDYDMRNDTLGSDSIDGTIPGTPVMPMR